MELALQTLVNGTVLAAVYALLGLSFGLIYSTTGIMHFAHGGTYTGAVYCFYAAYILLDWPLLAAAPVTVVFAALLGWATMQGFYQPLLARRASPAIVMIASLGLFIVFDNIAVLAFGSNSQVVSKGSVQQGLSIGAVFVTPLQLWTLSIASALIILVVLLIKRSRLGEAIRGMADDPGFAEIIGIDVRLLRGVVFALGSALLAAAAILVSLDIGVIPGAGLRVVLVAAVATILGGTGTMFGGLAGGVLVGLLESWGALYADPRWQNVIVFSVLIAVLVLHPAGLLSRRR